MSCIQNLEMYPNIRFRRRYENRIKIGEEALQMGVRLRCLKLWASVIVNVAIFWYVCVCVCSSYVN
jgi:hypothetical protein